MPQAFNLMDGFTVGADPELFIINVETGKYVSAEGLIPGTKEEPFKVDGGAVQVDGMAAEFNIDPCTTFKEFDHRNTLVMKQLSKMLPKNHELLPVPSVVFDKDVWSKAPDKAKELGCQPDLDAWTGTFNPPPHAENERLRTASGHLHFGWTENADLGDLEHINNCRDLVKQLDWYLGGWSVMADPEGKARRELYGKAGACRYKPYGVEYRVLSNFWLKSQTSRLAVWNRACQAIEDMRRTFIPDISVKWNLEGALIQQINTSVRDNTLESRFKFPILSYNPGDRRF